LNNLRAKSSSREEQNKTNHQTENEPQINSCTSTTHVLKDIINHIKHLKHSLS